MSVKITEGVVDVLVNGKKVKIEFGCGGFKLLSYVSASEIIQVGDFLAKLESICPDSEKGNKSFSADTASC